MYKATLNTFQIQRLVDLTFDIFYEQNQNSSYDDNRIIANKEMAISNIVNKVTANEEYQLEIINIVRRNLFEETNLAYKAVCSALMCADYEVITKHNPEIIDREELIVWLTKNLKSK